MNRASTAENIVVVPYGDDEASTSSLASTSSSAGSLTALRAAVLDSKKRKREAEDAAGTATGTLSHRLSPAPAASKAHMHDSYNDEIMYGAEVTDEPPDDDEPPQGSTPDGPSSSDPEFDELEEGEISEDEPDEAEQIAEAILVNKPSQRRAQSALSEQPGPPQRRPSYSPNPPSRPYLPYQQQRNYDRSHPPAHPSYRQSTFTHCKSAHRGSCSIPLSFRPQPPLLPLPLPTDWKNARR